MVLPPGVLYLSPRIPQLLAPPAVVYVASYVAKTIFNVAVPTWLLVLGYVLSWPLALTLSVQWYDYTIAREAAAAGATLPPVVESRSLAGIDLIQAIREDWSSKILCYRLAQYSETYGYTFNWRVLFQTRYTTSEPEYIKRILATDFQGYEKGPEFRFQMKSLLGTGVFNADGELWKFHRGMTRPFFSRDRISHFDVFDRHAEAAINLMKARLAEGFPVDWQDLVSRFTLDSATEFLFGQDVRSLSAGLPYPPGTPQAEADKSASHPANRFAHAFLEAQIGSAMRSRFSGAWPLWEFWGSKVDPSVKVMDEFIQPVLKEALSRKAQSLDTKTEEAVEDGATLLEHLVKLTDDPEIIRDETLNILLAGRDTTALTLTMAGYMLAEHPDIHRRLREEILTNIGTRRPTYDDIRELKYLRAFINEVLRMYPPVPVNVRFAVNATVWPASTPGGQPIYVPAGARCLYSVFIMHRRKDLWGPDAHKFDPDRFLDERVAKYLTPNPFIFLPFNAGPRICLGQQFAYNETSFMLIRLLQQISEIRLRQEANPEAAIPPGYADSPITDGTDKVLIKSHLTMFVQGGLWVEMRGDASENDANHD